MEPIWSAAAAAAAAEKRPQLCYCLFLFLSTAIVSLVASSFFLLFLVTGQCVSQVNHTAQETHCFDIIASVSTLSAVSMKKVTLPNSHNQ